MAIQIHILINQVRDHILACDTCSYDNYILSNINLAADEMDGLRREPIIRNRFESAKRRMLSLHSINYDGIRYVPDRIEAITEQLVERANWGERKRNSIPWTHPNNVKFN